MTWRSVRELGREGGRLQLQREQQEEKEEIDVEVRMERHPV